MKGFPYIILALGVVLTGASLVAWLGGPAMFGEKVKADAVGPIDWRNSSHFKMNSLLKVYFFNVTNAEDVIAGKKPKLQEVGPYVFEDNITRIIESMDEGKGIVTYKDTERFYFRPDLTNGKETDLLTIINVPFVGLAQEVSKLSSFARIMVMGVITRFNEGLFLRKTAKELLFEGYRHELLATLSSFTGEQYMKDNMFGLFYERNNSDHGKFSVSMGQPEALSDLGQIKTWNNAPELKWWKSESCNSLGGSFDGTVFPSGIITKDTVLTLFNPSLCRKLRYGFKETVNFQGIAGYRFSLLQEELEDPRIREENMCYCTSRGENYADCPKRGRYQMNACSKGASVSISLPHFLHGAKEYLEMVGGYHPDQSLHEPYIDIEPVTGTVLRVALRSQANFEVRPLRLFTEFRKVQKIIFPAIWVEEMRELPMERVAELAPSSKLLTISALVGGLVGIVLILVALYIIVKRLRKDRTKYNT